jgi:hypothetical protein
MRDTKDINFRCPAHLVEAIDRLATEEMLPRAAVIRRALVWEARSAGDLEFDLGLPATETIR